MEAWYGPLLCKTYSYTFPFFFSFSVPHIRSTTTWYPEVFRPFPACSVWLDMLCLETGFFHLTQFAHLLCAHLLCPLNTRTPGNEIYWNCNPQCKLHCVNANPAQNILNFYSEDTLEGHAYRGGWKGSRMIKSPTRDDRENKAPSEAPGQHILSLPPPLPKVDSLLSLYIRQINYQKWPLCRA